MSATAFLVGAIVLLTIYGFVLYLLIINSVKKDKPPREGFD